MRTVNTGSWSPSRDVADTVLTVGDMQPHKEALLAHMRSIGLVVPAPTKVLLALPGQVFPPESQRGLGHIGNTQWGVLGGRLAGPITIRIAGGLDGALFGKTLAHEYGHAVVASAHSQFLPLHIVEGFAECVAAEYLRTCGPDPRFAKLLAKMASNPDPIYGEGFRCVAAVVESLGLSAVAAGLRSGRLAPWNG